MIGDFKFTPPTRDDAAMSFMRPRAQGRYRIRIYDEKDALPVVICTEWARDTRRTVAEDQASRLARHVPDTFLGAATGLRWMIHHPAASATDDTFDETPFDLVESCLIERRCDGMPRALHRAEVESIVGQSLG